MGGANYSNIVEIDKSLKCPVAFYGWDKKILIYIVEIFACCFVSSLLVRTYFFFFFFIYFTLSMLGAQCQL